MTIPLNQRILVRQALKEVRMLTVAIMNYNKQLANVPTDISADKIPMITTPVSEYLKLVADARRVQYIVASIALAERGVVLPMPTDKSAMHFRENLDTVMNKVLSELNNQTVGLFLPDDGNPPDENNNGNEESKIIM
jgi:hypothetical protein